MSAQAWLREKADSYRQDADVLADLLTDREQGDGLTGQQWAIVYRAVAEELRKCAAEVPVLPSPERNTK